MLRKILIVEDDRSTALLLRRNLEKEGFHVFLAGNGLEALEILDKQAVDVIVTDVVMPRMDGVDLYVALKKHPTLRHLPIIIVTDKQLFTEAFSALGVEHFFPKGGDVRLLFEKIRTINQDLQRESLQKILVSGSNPLIVEQMQQILVTKRYLVTTAHNSANTLHQAFLMVPHIVLLDLRMQDHSEAKEVINSFRCFRVFDKLRILTYTYFTADELNYGSAQWQVMQARSHECDELGGVKFIGNFSQLTFLESITNYINEITASL